MTGVGQEGKGVDIKADDDFDDDEEEVEDDADDKGAVDLIEVDGVMVVAEAMCVVVIVSMVVVVRRANAW